VVEGPGGDRVGRPSVFGDPDPTGVAQAPLGLPHGCGLWVEHEPRIAGFRQVMTTRADWWATEQVGRHGRATSGLCAELECDWRTINDTDNSDLARTFVARLATDLQHQDCPPETRQLGPTIARWSAQISAWHQARVSSRSTEAANNPPKRVKRVAFGFTSFTNQRIRSLLNAGHPD